VRALQIAFDACWNSESIYKKQVCIFLLPSETHRSLHSISKYQES
jgi:hypothetical protein